jgi:hypothetical protein
MKNPTIPKVIIDYLDELYPPIDHNPQTPLREIDYHSGKRQVVNHLRSKYDEQNETILTPN